MQADNPRLTKLLNEDRQLLLTEWLRQVEEKGTLGAFRLGIPEVRLRSADLLNLLAGAVAKAESRDVDDHEFDLVRENLEQLARDWTRGGLLPTQIASFFMMLKDAVLVRLLVAGDGALDAEAGKEVIEASRLVRGIALYALEAFLRERDVTIERQREEILEISVPVMQVWDHVLALPIVGTLDSSRTHMVMEKLLESIARKEAQVVILDIGGVPAIDTLVAQHLIKTMEAARLMGAMTILSGIRPETAQTMVHLGIDFGLIHSRASLRDALRLAFKHLNKEPLRVEDVR